MRASLVILLCLYMVVVQSATTARRVVANGGRGTTKAPVRQSAYAYLRSIRGKTSCAGGSCPFWERHGRSFAALRCYREQYQECVCLHRMCFSSCMFTKDVCNQEMVSCLRQICPRCMPQSASAMCPVYDALAVKVADALSVFACYPCCPILANSAGNSTTTPSTNTVTITRPNGNNPTASSSNVGLTNSVGVTQNIGNAVTNGASRPNTVRPSNGNTQANISNRPPSNGNTQASITNRPPSNGNTQASISNRPPSNGNTQASISNRPPNGANGNTVAPPNVVFPGSNQAANANVPNPNRRVQKTVRTTARRVVTTRRVVTSKSTVRTPVQSQKKP